MAIDARGSWGHGGVRAFLHVNVAVATVHFQLASMNLVAERDRLGWLIARIKRQVIRGTEKYGPCVGTTGQGEHAEHRQEFVSPSRK